MNQRIHKARNRLVAEILETIPLELDDEPRIDDDRMLSVICGESHFTTEENALISRSAATHQRYYDLREVVEARRRRERQRWMAAGLQVAPVELAAADSEAPKLQRLKGGDYTVELVPLDAEGDSWQLVVTFSERLLAMAQDGLRIRDEESGVLWVAGVPDRKGRLFARFDQDPGVRQRLLQQRLMPEPM